MPKQQPEAYRLRIANTLYGPVEVSLDEGKSWTLIARVQKAAMTPGEGGTSSSPAVERVSKDGIAFSIGGRRLLRILPDLPANYKNGSALVVSMPRLSGIFKELTPPVGAAVQMIVNKHEASIPADYFPHDGDVFLITCPLGAIPDTGLPDQIKQLAAIHKFRVASKLQSQGKKPTNGTLTVTVNLASGERINALTYFLDGEVVGIQNQPPFVLKLDTRRWPNGEHVLEARAVDTNGAVVTQKKTLLFVENTTAAP